MYRRKVILCEGAPDYCLESNYESVPYQCSGRGHRGNARFFLFIAEKEDEGGADELDLPDKSRVVYYYRDDDFFFTDEDTTLRKGDEVVILTSSEHLAELDKRWHPHEVEDED